MKDKRQKMSITWPYANPHLAVYMFAAAATAASYGQPAASMYWNRAAAAAAAAAATTPTSTSPYHPLMIRAPATGETASSFINATPPPHHPHHRHVTTPETLLMKASPPIGMHSSTMPRPMSGSGCCTSPICHECPSSHSPNTGSPVSISSFNNNNNNNAVELTGKKLFQPYKTDLD